MSPIEAKNKGFTHHAELYGVSGYSKLTPDGGFAFEATTWIGDVLVEVCVYFDVVFDINKEGFPLYQGPEL
jgi:hypothetical protein